MDLEMASQVIGFYGGVAVVFMLGFLLGAVWSLILVDGFQTWRLLRKKKRLLQEQVDALENVTQTG